MAAFLGLLAFIFAVLFAAAATFYIQLRRDLKTALAERGRIEQQAKKALARFQAIADLEKYKSELDAKVQNSRALLPKFETLAEMQRHKEELTAALAELKQVDDEWRQAISQHESTLAQLKAQIGSVEVGLEMQSFGFYRPKYDFEDSEHYARTLVTVRDRQEVLVKSDIATHCPQEWTVDGSAAKGRKMIKEHAKLMLRAFNGECDAAIAKVKYNNVTTLETRINRSFDAVNKLGESKQLWITRDYFNLKLQELYLVHEHREKVETEREEQRQIKEQMREEEKALKEIEKAQKEAEKEGVFTRIRGSKVVYFQLCS
ncbi:MAG: DUF4041 domain-containing protein, partial [Planctomycetales bacterium]